MAENIFKFLNDRNNIQALAYFFGGLSGVDTLQDVCERPLGHMFCAVMEGFLFWVGSLIVCWIIPDKNEYVLNYVVAVSILYQILALSKRSISYLYHGRKIYQKRTSFLNHIAMDLQQAQLQSNILRVVGGIRERQEREQKQEGEQKQEQNVFEQVDNHIEGEK